MRARDPEAALRDFIAGAEDAPQRAKPTGDGRLTQTSYRFDGDAIQIKICGVTNANDARACVELGADMIGFNFYPSEPALHRA